VASTRDFFPSWVCFHGQASCSSALALDITPLGMSLHDLASSLMLKVCFYGSNLSYAV